MKKLKKKIQFVVDVYKLGDFTKAELLTKELIKSNGKVVFLYNLLGLILVEQKKIDEAINCYKEGIKIDPNFSMIYNNLGLLYFQHKYDGDTKKIENFYKKAIFLNQKLPEAHNNLGSLYNHLNKIEEAIECYKKAININPKFSFAHHNLGAANVSLGNFDEAKKCFRESIKLNPHFYDTHRMLSRITKYTNDDKHLEELKKIYHGVDVNNLKNRIDIGFALGKAYEDTKNFDESFKYYQEANTLQRKGIKFSIKIEKEKLEDIKKIYNKKLFTKYKKIGYSDYSPIFIVGMPRSSTTLVEQILSSHSKVYGADEVEFIPEIIKKKFGDKNLRLFFNEIVDFDKNTFMELGKDYATKMNNLSNNYNRTTDKLPENFLNIGFIKLILPKSKIIHCYRNPKDNCFSIFKNHFSSGKIKFAYEIKEIIEYYNLYNDLMNYWNNLFDDSIYNIRYENLISNTKNEIQKLLSYCDLDWSEKCLNFHNNKRPIKTASDTQARSKIYSSSVESWTNYKKHLAKDFEKLVK